MLHSVHFLLVRESGKCASEVKVFQKDRQPFSMKIFYGRPFFDFRSRNGDLRIFTLSLEHC